MAKATLHDRLVTALEARGWAKDPNPRTRKYTVLEMRSNPNKFFIGRSGALRLGPKTSDSRPASDWFKKDLLSEK